MFPHIRCPGFDLHCRVLGTLRQGSSKAGGKLWKTMSNALDANGNNFFTRMTLDANIVIALLDKEPAVLDYFTSFKEVG